MMPDFDTPIHHNPAAHIEPSNVRGSAVEDPFGPDFTIAENEYDQSQSLHTADSDNVASRRAFTPPLEAPAYAMLTFPDCVLYIRCTEFDLGRDEPFYRTYKAKLKRERRAERRLGKGRGSESLDGRPEPGAPSTYSEHGGAVGYDDPDAPEDVVPVAKRRRLQVLSHASSAKSIAPASLNLADLQENEASSTTEDFVEFVPIHPPLESDITKISRKHLHFVLKDDVWIMYVTGNGAYVDEEYYEKDSEKERPITIKSGAEIRVCTLLMQFHPANVEEDPTTSSPVLSSEPLSEAESEASSLGDDDDDEEMEDAGDEDSPNFAREGQSSKAKIKLKIRRRSDDDVEDQETNKKRKAPEDGFSEERDEQGGPPIPPDMADDSLLANESQLPAPRKGPGRPPKNGSFSKRDSTAMKRKEKEYLAKGLPVPDVAELLEIVRREQKENDAKKKARTNDMAPMDVRPSIEPINGGEQGNAFVDSKPSLEAPAGNSNSVPLATIPPSLPKERSQSPVKPKEECDENELKKPMDTYPVLIDIVLTTEPNRTADLQRIYHLMEKRWPYYRHCTEGKGWQSSVRHNLRDNKHFKNAGKSGKGWFWTINDEVPLDSKKNKRAPSPSHLVQPQMQNRAGPNGMQSMPHPGGQWNRGDSQMGGGYNNYAAPGMMPARAYGPHDGMAAAGSGAHNGQQANGLQPPPNGNGQFPQQPHGNQGGHAASGQPGPPPPRPPPPEREATPPPYNPLGSLINEIVTYRVTWFRSEANKGKSNDELSEIFRHATEHFSNDLHNLQNYMLSKEVVGTELALNLKRIFDERGSFGPSYYIRQALGTELRHVEGNMPEMPLGPPRDGLVYPPMTPEEIREYTAKGVGQVEYQNALRLAEEATRLRAAELARFRAERAARAARAQQFTQPPQGQHVNRPPQNAPAGNVAHQHNGNRQVGVNSGSLPQNGLPHNGFSQNVRPQNASPPNGPPQNAAQNAPHNGHVQNSLPQSSSVQNAGPQNVPAQNSPPQSGPAQNAPLQHVPVQNALPQNALPQNGPPQIGSTQNGLPPGGLPQTSIQPHQYPSPQPRQVPNVGASNSGPPTSHQASPIQPGLVSSTPSTGLATTAAPLSSALPPQRIESNGQTSISGQPVRSGPIVPSGNTFPTANATQAMAQAASDAPAVGAQKPPEQSQTINVEGIPSSETDAAIPQPQPDTSAINTSNAVDGSYPFATTSSQSLPANTPSLP
jgi:hypothetical protein